MTEDPRAALKDELARRAPEIDFEVVDPRSPIREAFDIDSMDFLNVLIGLHQRLGIEIPEDDYAELATIESAVEYLEAKLARMSP